VPAQWQMIQLCYLIDGAGRIIGSAPPAHDAVTRTETPWFDGVSVLHSRVAVGIEGAYRGSTVRYPPQDFHNCGNHCGKAGSVRGECTDGRQFSGHFTGSDLDPDASAGAARPLKVS